MIAEMSLQDAGELICANGFIIVAEPTSGAGGYEWRCGTRV